MADDIMTEDFTEVDGIPDVINDTEQYSETDHLNSDFIESETYTELVDSNEHSIEEKRPTVATIVSNKSDTIRTTRLPLARIKNIMKMDPDVNMVTSEAVFLVAKATEMFLETIVKETYSNKTSHKGKTLQKRDLDYTINVVDCLCFLEGAMDF